MMGFGQISPQPRVITLELGDLLVTRLIARPTGWRCQALQRAASRCLRHSLIIDEYRPSRRSNAPLAPGSHRSYSARILSLYCAE
jgi:hypothetical protein